MLYNFINKKYEFEKNMRLIYRYNSKNILYKLLFIYLYFSLFHTSIACISFDYFKNKHETLDIIKINL